MKITFLGAKMQNQAALVNLQITQLASNANRKKKLQNIEPRCFILTTQMKHFDFLMLSILEFASI